MCIYVLSYKCDSRRGILWKNYTRIEARGKLGEAGFVTHLICFLVNKGTYLKASECKNKNVSGFKCNLLWLLYVKWKEK